MNFTRVRYARIKISRAVRVTSKTSKNNSRKLILRRNWGTEDDIIDIELVEL